mmetsp:Transcript_45279/g.72352  ORF Transcript_45279/g.72352 Transcript_45279/m.72352 type:complete len:292 (-) Transcript_45279:128-1003(-)
MLEAEPKVQLLRHVIIALDVKGKPRAFVIERKQFPPEQRRDALLSVRFIRAHIADINEAVLLFLVIVDVDLECFVQFEPLLHHIEIVDIFKLLLRRTLLALLALHHLLVVRHVLCGVLVVERLAEKRVLCQILAGHVFGKVAASEANLYRVIAKIDLPKQESGNQLEFGVHFGARRAPILLVLDVELHVIDHRDARVLVRFDGRVPPRAEPLLLQERRCRVRHALRVKVAVQQHRYLVGHAQCHRVQLTVRLFRFRCDRALNRLHLVVARDLVFELLAVVVVDVCCLVCSL